MYKEIQLAISNGFRVEVICFEFDNWSKEINQQLKSELGAVPVISIPASRSPFLQWCWCVATENALRIAGKFFTLPVPLLAQAVSRRNNLLIKALNKVSTPDWVIGHNPGALWATAIAKKKFNCKAGFDVEDYHPGEGNDQYLQQLTKKLLQAVLPMMSYVSFGSPLIQREVEKDLGTIPGQWFTLMNYFPAAEFTAPTANNEGPVKLVWFSQNISYGRGLELILPCIKNLAGKVELHLIGKLESSFYQEAIKSIPNVIIHSPLSQKGLHLQLATFDIGLALEPAKDKNNELAISNKILAYLQAGLFVLATNTPAQYDLLTGLPGHGYCFDYRLNDSAVFIEKIIMEIDAIRSKSAWRYKNFSSQNWETASVKLLQTWKQG